MTAARPQNTASAVRGSPAYGFACQPHGAGASKAVSTLGCSSVVEQRFWRNVEVAQPNDCWVWTASVGRAGYGAYWLEGRCHGAHRLAYRFVNGPLEAGKVIMHKCDNRVCCNPAHLVQGTQSQNMKDCVSRGRANFKPCVGEANGAAKLTAACVRDLRRLYTEGQSIRSLARRFGVSRATAKSALEGVTWKHV